MKKLLSLCCALLLTAFAGAAFAADAKAPAAAPAAPAAPAPPPVAEVGEAVPDFTLLDPISGKQVNFTKDIKGKTTAIVFMNTGCTACLSELTEIDKLKKDVKDKLNVVAIAVDKRGEQVVKAYAEVYQFDATYLIDPTFTLPPQFGFNYTPAMILVGKDGMIKLSRGGFNPSADQGKVAAAIKALL